MASGGQVKIVVPDDNPSVFKDTEAQRRLEKSGDVTLYTSDAADAPALIERLKGAAIAVNIRGRTKFTREGMAALPELRLISIWGTGTDNMDLAAARELGVCIMNTPGVGAIAMAEGTLALMLAAAKRTAQIDADVKRGTWPRVRHVQLHGKVLGIVGTGAIGRQMARLGRGIGMEVIAWTYHPDEAVAREIGFRYVGLEELLRTADVVSLHVRLSPEATGMIGRAQLALMKPTAILVNTARGAVVDHAALVEALRDGRLAAAGIDVYPVEPVPANDPILSLSNAVLSPHAAGATPEAGLAGMILSADNVADFLAGRPKAQYVVVPGTR